MRACVNNSANKALKHSVTLSINLPNLHYDKQMFKYPTQAAERSAERSGAEPTRNPRVILSRIRAVSTRYPSKQVQNGQTVQIHASHPPRNFCCIGVNNTQGSSLSSLRAADSAEESCRCPLLFSATPIHDPKAVKHTQARDTIRPEQNAWPTKHVPIAAVGWLDKAVRLVSLKPYSSLRSGGKKTQGSQV